MVRFCTSNKCLIGKTAIITGANRGIGYETALDFAKRGCRVILACRDYKRATEARQKIVDATGNTNIIVKLIDLSSLRSVRLFAKEINETENRLDLLINNAGTACVPRKITEDGLQLMMATNYFGHFLLTNLLLDLLKRTFSSRIINVSSVMAMMVRNLELDFLNDFPGHTMLYARSKLCNIMFTKELARKLRGTSVTTYSLHPGVVNTELFKFSSFLPYIADLCFRSPQEGAQTSIYLALENDIEVYHGEHFYDCRRVKSYCNTRNDEKAKMLWQITEGLVGLNR